MARTKARKRPFPRRTTYGREFGQGPRCKDGVGGFELPIKLTVEQRGVRVSIKRRDGTLDKPDTY